MVGENGRLKTRILDDTSWLGLNPGAGGTTASGSIRPFAAFFMRIKITLTSVAYVLRAWRSKAGF
jgi:hypothetical protein